MDDVSLRHAKEHLEQLIERAQRGEDVRIADDKLGVVRIVPARPSVHFPPRTPGLMKGKVHIPDDKLFEPLSEDELALLSGESSL